MVSRLKFPESEAGKKVMDVYLSESTIVQYVQGSLLIEQSLHGLYLLMLFFYFGQNGLAEHITLHMKLGAYLIGLVSELK